MLKIVSSDTYKLLLCLILSLTSTRVFFDLISAFLTGSSLVGKIVFYLIFIVCLFVSYPMYKKSISSRNFLLLFIWFFYCYFSAINTPYESDLYIERLKYIIFFGGIYFLVGNSLSGNIQLAQTAIYKLPLFLNIIGFINALFLNYLNIAYAGIENLKYSMLLSYANLPPALICVVALLICENNCFKRNGLSTQLSFNKIYYSANLFFSVFLILFHGSRGPLLSILSVIVMSILYLLHKNHGLSQFIFIILISIPVISFIIIFFILFGESLASLRFFTFLNNADVLNSSGREMLYSNSLLGIKDNPLFGMGAFNDRVYLFDSFHHSYTLNSLGSYSHNFILEILLQFGIPIGILFLLLLLNMLRQGFKLSVHQNSVDIYMLLLGIGLFPLAVSRSYIETWEFYLLFGFLINCKSRVF